MKAGQLSSPAYDLKKKKFKEIYFNSSATSVNVAAASEGWPTLASTDRLFPSHKQTCGLDLPTSVSPC